MRLSPEDAVLGVRKLLCHARKIVLGSAAALTRVVVSPAAPDSHNQKSQSGSVAAQTRDSGGGDGSTTVLESREWAAREVLHWDAAAVPARGLGLFWLDPSSTQHYGTDAVRRQGFQHHCVGRADDILIWRGGPSSAGTACGYEASWHSDVLEDSTP